MKIGIVTLVSDNYGNKYQNYAVEQLLSKYGEVITYRVSERNDNLNTEAVSGLRKLRPSHIVEALRCRMMYLYDITNMERSVLGNLLYVMAHKKKLVLAKQKRAERFADFQRAYLHISDRTITNENCKDMSWNLSHDYFVCGSDQIWNPHYGTTTDLAFLSFAPGRSIALAPSFGVSEIPDTVRDCYRCWIDGVAKLSVREETGRRIIKELTGKEAEVLLDPTMAIQPDAWKELAKVPQTGLPDNYILTYFLGRVSKEYKNRVKYIAEKTGLKVVNLFNIEERDYYVFDPNEVLFAIQNASMVLTDSFHGTVFSILFKRNFQVFHRDEGGESMHSRLSTLLGKLGLEERLDDGISLPETITEEKWSRVFQIISNERNRLYEYLKCAINKG